tara:strand:+ start:1171 stop:1695 length:525 start_codon:yes stop_codon:yes gene_type:complete
MFRLNASSEDACEDVSIFIKLTFGEKWVSEQDEWGGLVVMLTEAPVIMAALPNFVRANQAVNEVMISSGDDLHGQDMPNDIILHHYDYYFDCQSKTEKEVEAVMAALSFDSEQTERPALFSGVAMNPFILEIKGAMFPMKRLKFTPAATLFSALNEIDEVDDNRLTVVQRFSNI